MKTVFTIESIKNSKVANLNQHLFESAPKRSKYGSNRTEVEGQIFDSKKEAKRFTALRMLLKAGRIGMLARQVEYELNQGGSHSLIYRADFVYMDMETGKTIVEDCKGFLTKEYKRKRKLMKKVHGIEITEI